MYPGTLLRSFVFVLFATTAASPAGTTALERLSSAPAADRAALDALFDGRRSAALPTTAPQESLDSWLSRERTIALERMERNISPAGAAAGAVAASPSRQNPDYFFHWRRDAAQTMEEIVALYAGAADPAQKTSYFNMLMDYVAFTKKIQSQQTLTGLGEPLFRMDGTPFNDPWGRPQNDSPAEEASVLIDFASVLIKEGHMDLATGIYGDFAAGVKADLEYVSHHWSETSFDAWEEVKARHFDTETADRLSLAEGAWLADQVGDPEAARWYRAQADRLKGSLDRHWDPARDYIDSALDRDAGLADKTSGLDSAVILAAIHRRPLDAAVLSPADDAFYSVTDKRVLATAEALKNAFKAEYALNQRFGEPGVAIGRYPEDRFFNGNPWFLLTAAFAQLDYMAAGEFIHRGVVAIDPEDLAFFRDLVPAGDQSRLHPGMAVNSGDPLFGEIVDGLKAGGDSFLAEVRAHAAADGSLSEQFDKKNGFMLSAPDLTWSYAALLSALRARDALETARGGALAAKRPTSS